MDIRKVFRGISKKLYSDFEISAQINHDGTMGDFRENSLREFLQNGRLPKRLGVGKGEIVGHISNVSKQSDLIIYDQLDSIPLLYDKDVQVYPIDCVYGIIEVKSQLKKTRLIEALDNIKSVKQLTPDDYVRRKVLFMEQQYKRPRPFGFVFAFSLAENSLNSLTQNLAEWEKLNPPESWPNLIVVLGEGIIYHTESGFDKRIISETINEKCKPTNLSYKDDAFFYLYSYLLDICNNIELPKIEISQYLDLPQKIGKYTVENNDRIVRFDKEGKIEKEKVYRLNEKFIDKLVQWCKARGQITQEEMLLMQFGEIPHGSRKEFLKKLIYFYNPDDLPGIHQVENAITIDEKGNAVTKERLISPSGFITIDKEVYYYPFAYVTESDYEEIQEKKLSDL